jgi:hypothetical protein
MADKAMVVYLNDHLAGVMLGSDLAEQIRSRNRGTPLGELMGRSRKPEKLPVRCWARADGCGRPRADRFDGATRPRSSAHPDCLLKRGLAEVVMEVLDGVKDDGCAGLGEFLL